MRYLRPVHAFKCARSCPRLCDPMDCGPPGSLSIKFSRQEYWSRLPFPSPRDLPDPGIEPTSPALAGGFFTTAKPGKSLWDLEKLNNSPNYMLSRNGNICVLQQAAHWAWVLNLTRQGLIRCEEVRESIKPQMIPRFFSKHLSRWYHHLLIQTIKNNRETKQNTTRETEYIVF